jgi:flagellar hook-length control protein FliK
MAARPVKTAIGPDGGALTFSLPDRQDGDTSLTASGGASLPSSTQIRVSAVNGPATAPQLPINAIAAHISSQFVHGNRRFDIRLDPPELGRVDVRLRISRDGTVTTHLVVEKSETLDLLQRDARALERALQDTGLDAGDGGLSFSLKEHGFAGQSFNEGESKAEAGGGEPGDETGGGTDGPGGDDAAAGAYMLRRGLDIRI